MARERRAGGLARSSGGGAPRRPRGAAPRRESAPASGRGAITNVPGRFSQETLAPEDDGWGILDEPLPPLPTTVTPDATRTIITRNDSPDVPFDRSINPYKGCEHGCSYCFARQTHAYLGLSPGLDFETRIVSKPDAARLLGRELARPGYRCEVIAIGSNTDPYQPVERRLGIMRSILEVLAEHRHPVGIVTKSNLVLRDIDLLAPMAARNLAHVMFSVTTLDRALARRMEPRAPTPERRLHALHALREAGVPAGVLVAPVIPGLTDTEIERILEAAAEAGALWAGFQLVRLPLEVKEVFREWLEANVPLRAERVLSLIRQTRGGRLSDATFGRRMRGTGPYAKILRDRFAAAARRLGLDEEPEPLDTTQFRVPARHATTARAPALGLFGDEERPRG